MPTNRIFESIENRPSWLFRVEKGQERCCSRSNKLRTAFAAYPKKGLAEAQLQLLVAHLEAELEETRSEIGAVRLDVARLEDLCESIASRLQKTERFPGYFAVRDAIDKVKAMTRDLFPGKAVECVEREDGEIAGDRYFTFIVVAPGERTTILPRYNEWHTKLAELPSDVRKMFRLSLDVRK